jgi:hypothetical protein
MTTNPDDDDEKDAVVSDHSAEACIDFRVSY